ncbi:MAG: polyprenyl synthetase family protein [Bacteroidales bacterium]
MYTLGELLEIINKEIAHLEFDGEPKELYQPVKYSLEAGGKRIRPVLVLAGCNLFTEDISVAIHPALAIEIFHNFTLLHDDIMDKAELRRNLPTVHKKWNENIAILSGDAMLIRAYQELIKAPATRFLPIIELFSKTAIEVCEGQQYDMNFEMLRQVSEEQYLEMIKLKTSVLLAASLKTGALCGMAGERDCNLIYDFGLNLGLAFQLQDDYLDTFGEKEKFGKYIGGDIAANKKTYLLVKAIELANQKDLETIYSLLSAENINRNEKYNKMISIFNDLNIKNIVKDKIEYFYQLAIKSLDVINVETTRKIVLKEFAEKLMERES